MARNGRIVSSVAIYPTAVRTPRGQISVAGINCFGTDPDYRRQGLGARVLEDAHAKMRADGHHIGLLRTYIPNYYRRLGWEYGGRQRTFVLDRGNILMLPSPAGLEVTEDWRAHVDELARLHDREPLAADRALEFFALVMERKFRRVFVAKRRGAVVAYAAVSANAVRETGGAPEDMAALLNRVYSELDDSDAPTSVYKGERVAALEMEVETPDTPDGLPGYLLSRGVPNHLGYAGMVLILNAQRLLDALHIGDVGLEPRKGGWRLRHDGKTLDLNQRQLVKLIFGPERFPDFAPDVFPIDFYQWSMDRV